MALTAGNFLILNGAIVTLLVIYFLFLKNSPSRPTKLNLKTGAKASPKKQVETQVASNVEKPSVVDAAVPLNVIFNFNGHSFDAYEALGVPAGSSLQQIERAYSKCVSEYSQDSLEFYKAAHKAIRQQLT